MRKLRKSFIVDVRMGFKYASGITFTAEEDYRMSIFVLYSQRQLMLYRSNFSAFNAFIAYCFSYIISDFQLFRKENVIMPIKHAKFSLLSLPFLMTKIFSLNV